jgi:hypothetical protein
MHTNNNDDDDDDDDDDLSFLYCGALPPFSPPFFGVPLQSYFLLKYSLNITFCIFYRKHKTSN